VEEKKKDISKDYEEICEVANELPLE